MPSLLPTKTLRSAAAEPENTKDTESAFGWKKRGVGGWDVHRNETQGKKKIAETHGLGFTQTFLNQLSSGIFKSGLIYGSCTMSVTETPR